MSNLQRQVRVGIALFAVLVFLSLIVTTHAKLNGSTARAGGSNQAPTVAKVVSFKATVGKGGALLEWRTGFEVDNLGFNLYRERNGQRTQINPSIIAGSALTAGPKTELAAGRSYIWRDAQGSADSLYYLESIDLNGQTILTGPVAPSPGSVATTAKQAVLLSNLGSETSVQAEGPSTLMTANAAPQSSAETLQTQWNIAAQPAVKIGVRQNDWYHVTQADLVAAGLSASANANNLQLFVDGVEQPMLVKSSNGQFAPGDYIEFYGTALDLTETDTHVYWLINGSSPGKRIRLIGNERPDSDGGQGSDSKGGVTPILTKPGVQPPVLEDARRGTLLWTAMTMIGVRQEEISQPTPQQRTRPAQSRDEAAPAREIGPAPTVDVGPVEVRNSDESVPVSTPRPSESAKTVLAPSEESAAPGVSKVKSPATVPAAKSAVKSGSEKAQAQPGRARARKAKARPARRRGAARRELAHFNPAASGAADGGEAQSFSYTVEVKDRTVYFSSLQNGDKENFFGKVVASLPVTQSLTVSHLDANAPSSSTASLEVALQGVSPQPHNVRILFNETEVGFATYFFRDHYLATLTLPAGLLHDGVNTVKLATVTGGDVSIIDYIRLTYPHTYTADANNSLRFTLRNSQTARVEGFTTPDVRVIDITDPKDVQQLKPTIEPSGAGYALLIGTPGRNLKGRRTLVVFPVEHSQQPAQLVANQPSTLNNAAQGADLAIISYRTLKQNIAPLANLRSSQGLAVSVVDIDDVYDEFSYGTHTPQAIKDFLFYTTTHWAKSPRFVLLVGDSSYDPKNYLKAGDWDLVPSRLVDTLFTETSSDDWLADFNGDFVPDMALGRLPARTTADLDKMVAKIVGYNPSAATRTALFVADAQGTYPFSFEQENKDIAALLPSDVTVTHVNRASNPDINVVRSQLFSSINQGPLIVNYAGHGTVDAWTGAQFFTNSDALNLTNGTSNGNHLPLFVMMTCLTGYYNDPVLDSLSESLLKAPKGGAVAVWASSGLTVPSGQSLMNQSLYQSLFSDPSPTLGEAIQKAKAATPDTDVRLTWTLFGDPSMKIR